MKRCIGRQSVARGGYIYIRVVKLNPIIAYIPT